MTEMKMKFGDVCGYLGLLTDFCLSSVSSNLEFIFVGPHVSVVLVQGLW